MWPFPPQRTQSRHSLGSLSGQVRALFPPRRLLLVCPEPSPEPGRVLWAIMQRARGGWVAPAQGEHPGGGEAGSIEAMARLAAQLCPGANDAVLVAPGPDLVWQGSERYSARLRRSLPAILQHAWPELLPWDPATCVLMHQVQPLDQHELLVTFHALRQGAWNALLQPFQEAGLRYIRCMPLSILVEYLAATQMPEATVVCRSMASGGVQCFRRIHGVVDAAALLPDHGQPQHPEAVVWRLGMAQLQAEAPETVHDWAGETASWADTLTHAAITQGALPTFHGPFRLTPLRPQKKHWQAAAILLCFLLAGAGLQGWAGYLDEELSAVQAQNTAFAKRFAALEAREKELDTLLALEQALETHAAEQPRLEAVLDQLTRLTPKDTWLREFCLEDGQLRLAGESAAALAYRDLLAGLPWVRDVVMREAVARVPETGKERFVLAVQLDARQLDAMGNGSMPHNLSHIGPRMDQEPAP